MSGETPVGGDAQSVPVPSLPLASGTDAKSSPAPSGGAEASAQSATARAAPPAPPPAAPMAAGIPTVVTEVRGELIPKGADTWQPASYSEWEARERSKTFLAAWAEQMSHERSLRSFTAKSIFALIVAQVVATFSLVIAQGLGWLQVDRAILQVLIPSVLGEVFGLGFLVTKYLFSQPLRHGLDSLVEGARNGH